MKLIAAALLALALLAACGGSGTDAPTEAVDDLAAHDSQPCPAKLPQAPVSTYGIGTEKPATSTPKLPTADAGWVCTYAPTDAGPGPDGQGTSTGWTRSAAARKLDAAETDGIARLLGDLAPAERNQACTSDLGRRIMVVLSAQGDLTGVVIDDFGCRTVRLTDEPFKTVPGDAKQGGAVSGTLTPSPSLRSALLGAAGTG